MIKWKKIVLIAVGALAVLVLFTATVLPVLVRNKAVEVLREATGRNVRIEKISLNPLTLTASVQGFAVEESGGGPFLSVGVLQRLGQPGVALPARSGAFRGIDRISITPDRPSGGGPLQFLRYRGAPEEKRKNRNRPEFSLLF